MSEPEWVGMSFLPQFHYLTSYKCKKFVPKKHLSNTWRNTTTILLNYNTFITFLADMYTFSLESYMSQSRGASLKDYIGQYYECEIHYFKNVLSNTKYTRMKIRRLKKTQIRDTLYSRDQDWRVLLSYICSFAQQDRLWRKRERKSGAAERLCCVAL